MITIDKNVPMEERTSIIYPWDEMEVGDSFLFPKDYKRNSARAMAWQRSHSWRDDKKFKIKTTPEGIRCWRIA